jgi:lipid-A-disaccharide synthase
MLGVKADTRFLAVLPGSRKGEVARHVPILAEAARELRNRTGVTPIVALPTGFGVSDSDFLEPFRTASIQVIEGHAWDVLAHSELALAASGTVTIEAALLGTPMVTFYRVNALSWYLARWMVRAPFLSMVNLVAERKVVAELIQSDMTAANITGEALRLLEDNAARDRMRSELAEVARKLSSAADPMEIAADCVEQVLAEVEQ